MGTVAFGLWQLRKSCGGYLYRPRLVRSLVPAMVTTGIGNHTLTLCERVPGLVLPIVVTELLSPQANAYWYVIWMSALEGVCLLALFGGYAIYLPELFPT